MIFNHAQPLACGMLTFLGHMERVLGELRTDRIGKPTIVQKYRVRRLPDQDVVSIYIPCAGAADQLTSRMIYLRAKCDQK